MPYNDTQAGFRTPGQIPLDYKLRFNTLEQLGNFGNNSEYPFSYYDQMIVFCLESKTEYIWREVKENEVGIVDSFTYPDNSITEGIDYSNKVYSFFKYFNSNTFENVNNVIDNIIQEDKIWRGNIIYENNLTFTILDTTFSKGGLLYLRANRPLKQITLSDPDDSFSRIDVFAVDSRTGGVVVIEGTAADIPVETPVEFEFQIRMTAVLITSNGEVEIIPNEEDTPSVITTGNIYNENLGAPNEWNAVVTTGNTVLNDGTNPQDGNLAIRVPNSSETLEVITFTPENPIAYDINGTLIFHLKSEERFNTSSRIQITLVDSEGTTSRTTLGSRNVYGFNSDDSQWQIIAIPIIDIAISRTTLIDIQSIVFTIANLDVIHLDNIRYQSSTVTLISGSTFDPSQDIDFTGVVSITPPSGVNNISFLEGFVNVINKDLTSSVYIDSEDIIFHDLTFIPSATVAIRRPKTMVQGNFSLFLPSITEDDTLALKSELSDLTTSKYSETFGDGNLDTIPINHDLGTKDYTYRITEISTGLSVDAVVQDVDDNNINVIFSGFVPNLNQFRITLIS